MKILMVVFYLWKGGGTETYLHTLCRRLQQLGNQVSVYTTGGSWINRFTASGIPVHIGSMTGDSIVAYAVRNHFQLLHLHDSPSFSAVTESGNKGIPTIMTVHGTYVDRKIIRMCAKHCKTVIVVSPNLIPYAEQCGVLAEKCVVIPNGIATSRFRPSTRNWRKKWGWSQDTFVVGYAGRFTMAKQQLGKRIVRYLAAYAREHPDVRIVVAGRNSKVYAQSAKQLRVVGHVERMHRFYNTCDVVVGTGRVALEALASGVPTVAVGESDYLGLIDEHRLDEAFRWNFGDHGAGVRSWNARTLFQDLDKVKSHRRVWRKKVFKIRLRTQRFFSATVMAKSYVDVYQRSFRKA